MHYFSKLVTTQFGGGGIVSFLGCLHTNALKRNSDLNPIGKKCERTLKKEEWTEIQGNTERNNFKHLEKRFLKGKGPTSTLSCRSIAFG